MWNRNSDEINGRIYKISSIIGNTHRKFYPPPLIRKIFWPTKNCAKIPIPLIMWCQRVPGENYMKIGPLIPEVNILCTYKITRQFPAAGDFFWKMVLFCFRGMHFLDENTTPTSKSANFCSPDPHPPQS